jgi:hypothetical protein
MNLIQRESRMGNAMKTSEMRLFAADCIGSNDSDGENQAIFLFF